MGQRVTAFKEQYGRNPGKGLNLFFQLYPHRRNTGDIFDEHRQTAIVSNVLEADLIRVTSAEVIFGWQIVFIGRCRNLKRKRR